MSLPTGRGASDRLRERAGALIDPEEDNLRLYLLCLLEDPEIYLL